MVFFKLNNNASSKLWKVFTPSLLLFLLSCFSVNTFSETYVFSQLGSESGWRTSETDSIKKEAKKQGVTLKFSDAQQKQESQIKAVRAYIAQGVDGILIAPVIETGWDQVLKEAKRTNFNFEEQKNNII